MMKAEMESIRLLAGLGREASSPSSKRAAPTAEAQSQSRLKLPQSPQDRTASSPSTPVSNDDLVRWKNETDARFNQLSQQLSAYADRLADYEEAASAAGSIAP